MKYVQEIPGFLPTVKPLQHCSEPRRLEKEVINSFHILFGNEASYTFGISEPGNAAIKTGVPLDPDLNMELTDKIWVVMC